jgi:hypothetical protein
MTTVDNGGPSPEKRVSKYPLPRKGPRTRFMRALRDSLWEVIGLSHILPGPLGQAVIRRGTKLRHTEEKYMNEKVITSYADYREYEKALKARSKWSESNDYEVFHWSLCLDCKYFKIDPSCSFHGDCELMRQEGAYPGVMTEAVCNRFMSKKGTDINGKVIDPGLLPSWVKTRKDRKTGKRM